MDDFRPHGVVIADEVTPGCFISLCRRDEGLSREQVRLTGQCVPLRERKLETSAIIERITRGCGEARVPHKPWKESCIDDHGRAAHVARPASMRPDHLIAVNAN